MANAWEYYEKGKEYLNRTRRRGNPTFKPIFNFDWHIGEMERTWYRYEQMRRKYVICSV